MTRNDLASRTMIRESSDKSSTLRILARQLRKCYESFGELFLFDTFDSFSTLFFLLFGLFIVFPTGFLVRIMFTQFSDSGDSISPVRCLLAFLMPLYIAAWGFKRKSLNYSGAFSAYIVGFVMTMSSYVFATSLVVFFIVCSKATKVKASMKRNIEADYNEGGQRTWVQVFCNGGVAMLYSFLYMLETGCRERPVDISSAYYQSSYILSVLGALACACGDTLASELGSVYSKRVPVLITSLRRVPRGTNGGVSAVGFAASALGGFLIGISFFFVTLLSLNSYVIRISPPQWPLIIVGTIMGLVGSIIDSYMGALFQFSGLDKQNRVVSQCGPEITKINGFNILDNHSVNFLSVLFSALLAPRIGLFIWSFVS